MNTRTAPKPTWITLYSLGLIGMAALFFTPSLHVAPMMHTIIMLLIVAALYGAIGMWIQANSYALEVEEYEQITTQYTIHYDVMHQSDAQDAVDTVEAAETELTETHEHTEAA
jgi:hypothetical protein